jgi:hypothetical protein
MIAHRAQPIPANDVPLEIETVDDEVVFLGPGAVAFAMTRRAASETAARLCRILARVEDPASGDGAPLT